MRSAFLSIALFTFGLFVGSRALNGSQDATAWSWIDFLTLAVTIICIVGIGILTWTKHHKSRSRQLAELADNWEGEQSQRRKAIQLEEFWQSPAGRFVRESPFLADDSVRIEPIKGGRIPKTFLGLYTMQISATHVAHIQVISPGRWQSRVMKFIMNRWWMPTFLFLWIGRILGYKRKGDGLTRKLGD